MTDCLFPPILGISRGKFPSVTSEPSLNWRVSVMTLTYALASSEYRLPRGEEGQSIQSSRSVFG